MANNRAIELAKKLNELAKQGVGGEKTNAEKMLGDFLKKHSLTLNDIEGEKISDYFFFIEKSDHGLFYQILKHVNRNLKLYGEFPEKQIKDLKLQGNYYTSCTVAEFIEIKSKFHFYSILYKSELKVFFTAFIRANKLFVAVPESELLSIKDLSPEKQEELLRAEEMGKAIRRESFRKQLK